MLAARPEQARDKEVVKQTEDRGHRAGSCADSVSSCECVWMEFSVMTSWPPIERSGNFGTGTILFGSRLIDPNQCGAVLNIEGADASPMLCEQQCPEP